eukprot:jgi/Tetstr1/444953/TSEL_032771.t1
MVGDIADADTRLPHLHGSDSVWVQGAEDMLEIAAKQAAVLVENDDDGAMEPLLAGAHVKQFPLFRLMRLTALVNRLNLSGSSHVWVRASCTTRAVSRMSWNSGNCSAWAPAIIVLDEYRGMLRSDLEHVLGALHPHRIRTVEVWETRISVGDVPDHVGLVKQEELVLGERVRADIQQRVPMPSVAQGAVEGRVAGLGGSPAAGEMDVFPSSDLVGVAAAVGNGPPAPVSDDGGSSEDNVMGVREDPVGEDGMDIDAPAWRPAGVEAADEGVVREGDPGDFYMKVIAKKFRGVWHYGVITGVVTEWVLEDYGGAT